MILAHLDQKSSRASTSIAGHQQNNLFFYLDNRMPGQVQGRSGTAYNYAYHPLLIESFNRIASDNEISHFVEELVSKAGYPIWDKAFAYSDKSTHEDFVIIPMSFVVDQRVNSFISLLRKPGINGNNFVINTVSKTTVMDTTTSNIEQKLAHANWLQTFDKLLFDSEDAALIECICNYESQLSGGPSGPPNPPVGCVWHYLAFYNYQNQLHLTGLLPPHLDHDRDGTPNEFDEDFKQLPFGQESWENYVRDWWEQTQQSGYYEHEAFDMDYDDFWEAVYEGEDYDFGGDPIDWEHFWDLWEDMFENVGDFFDDLWPDRGFDDLWEDIDRWFGRWDIRCWGDGVVSVEERGELVYMWVLICNDGTGNWWEGITEIQPENPYGECIASGGGYPGELFNDRLHCYWLREYADSDPDWELFWREFANAGCDPLSIDFEQCIDIHYFSWKNGLDQEKRDYLIRNPDFFEVMSSFVEDNGTNAASIQALKSTINLQMHGWFDKTDWTEAELEYVLANEFEPALGTEGYFEVLTRFNVLRAFDPRFKDPCGGWCKTQAMAQAIYDVSIGWVHTALDICGLIVLAGEFCDVTNGFIYLIEGDGVNATFSFAASIPIVGWASTAGKYIHIGLQVAPGVYKELKITYNGTICIFSHNTSSAFRAILNMNGAHWTDFQAHHIIPKSLAEHPIVQKAAKAGQYTFHMNHVKNGIPLHNSRHLGNHQDYNIAMQQKLNQLNTDFPHAYPSEIATRIDGFLHDLKSHIENTNLHIEDYADWITDYEW